MMEPEAPEQVDGPWQRPAVLRWLCTLSFVDQAVFILLYLMGIVAALALREMPQADVEQFVRTSYSTLLSTEQMDAMMPMVELIRTRGVVLFLIFLARTIARAIGVFRMWHGHLDGLHIYITAQLIGILLPMLAVDTRLFSLLGLMMALNWCYLYWSLRRVLR